MESIITEVHASTLLTEIFVVSLPGWSLSVQIGTGPLLPTPPSLIDHPLSQQNYGVL